MSKKFRSLVAVVLFALSLHASAATSPQLAGQILQALNQLDEQFGLLTTLQKAVQEVGAGQTPSATQPGWSNLSQSYLQAAAQIRDLPLPSDFDRSAYAVSDVELTTCGTRKAAIGKLKSYAEAINKGAVADDQLVARLDKSLEQARQARQAVAYLKEANLRLAGSPLYGSTFAFNWFDLENNVSKALATVETALAAKRKKVVEEAAKARQHAGNLASNVAGMVPCTLAGRWVGSCALPSGPNARVIRIQGSGPYTCQREYPNGSVSACEGFAFDESSRAVSFTYVQSGNNSRRRWQNQGSVSANYNAMSFQARAVPIHNASGTNWFNCSMNKN